MAKKLVRSQTIVDELTGEVLSVEKQYSMRTGEPDYVKLYIKAWCEFKELKGINTTFLYKLLPLMNYANDGQYIAITTFFKKRISKELGWSEKTALNRFSQEIKKLCRVKILKRVAQQTYQVNPELIGRGEWKDIQKLRAVFNLETGEVTHEYAKEKKNSCALKLVACK